MGSVVCVGGGEGGVGSGYPSENCGEGGKEAVLPHVVIDLRFLTPGYSALLTA